MTDHETRTTSDREAYTHAFFEDCGGNTLEVAHLWGDHVLSVSSFDRPRTVTLGPGRSDDFQVGAEGLDAGTPLVRHDGHYHLVFTGQMSGYVSRGGESHGLGDLVDRGIAEPLEGDAVGWSVPMGARTTARLEFEGNTFLVHFTEMPGAVDTSVDFDREPLRFQATSAAVHVGFLMLALSLPANAGDLSLDRHSDADRFVEMMVQPDKKEEKEADWMKDGQGAKESADPSGQERGESGKAPGEEKTSMAVDGPPTASKPSLEKVRDEEVATSAGVLQAMNGSQVASQFGESSNSVGGRAMAALDDLDADSAGGAGGDWGLGLRGAGRGGGEDTTGEGVGIGQVDTDGRGGNGPDGDDYGDEAADLGTNEEQETVVYSPPPEVTGPLSREIIRRVVRQHRREIKYCYEKELQSNPELAGRVTVNFTITPSGDVVSALVEESSLGNTAVEQCMQNKIRHWTFPGTDQPGMVQVNYPFNFSAE